MHYALSPEQTAISYVRQPFFNRKRVGYNPDFLGAYIPNETYFLSHEQRATLLQMIEAKHLTTTAYKENKRLLEMSLIDLSFASSSLEGNTYSYLDTEILIKYNEVTDGKTKEETQMILNHKQAIEYLVWYKKDLQYDQKTFCELHQLLAQ